MPEVCKFGPPRPMGNAKIHTPLNTRLPYQYFPHFGQRSFIPAHQAVSPSAGAFVRCFSQTTGRNSPIAHFLDNARRDRSKIKQLRRRERNSRQRDCQSPAVTETNSVPAGGSCCRNSGGVRQPVEVEIRATALFATQTLRGRTMRMNAIWQETRPCGKTET